MHKTGEYQDFSSTIFCLTVPKEFVGNFSELCFRKFLVAKETMDKKGGNNKTFHRKFFVSPCPKIFLGESFTVDIISDTEKLWLRARKYQDFPSKNFFPTEPKFSVRESFTVEIISGIEKIWLRVGW